MERTRLKSSTLSNASRGILEFLDCGWEPRTGEALGSMLEKAAEALDAAAGEISLFDRSTKSLTFAASCGIKRSRARGRADGGGVPGFSRRFFSVKSPGGVQSLVSLPISDGGEMLGLLSLYFREKRKFSGEEGDFLNVLLILLSGRISGQSAEVKERVKSHLEIAKVLIKVMEEKDPYTRGHSERVKDYAVRIGGKMKLEGENRSALSEFSILHDIGKITIDSHILNRPRRLNSDEWEIVREHPLTGERIIRSADGFSTSIPMIKHHHERLDGSGYPDGLKGDEIPLLARIVSVCDSFDAMVSTRAYRGALPVRNARDELVRNSGRQFDGEIVGIMAELIDSGEITAKPPV